MVEEIAVTAAFHKPIIVVIVNNANLGLIRQNQKGAYGFEYAVGMPYNQDGTMDYVKVAEGFGCVGERVFTPFELREALERAKTAGKTYICNRISHITQLLFHADRINNISSVSYTHLDVYKRQSRYFMSVSVRAVLSL